MQMIQARWYAQGNSSRPKDLVVLHDMEMRDSPGSAVGVGNYFARLPAGNKASAHIGVDASADCRYVNDNDIAYGAPPCNHNGLHLEQTGYASYMRGDWSTVQMMAMLHRAVVIVQAWCLQYGIPKVFVNAAGLLRGQRGITTHAEITKAWGQTSHTDPGTAYPIDWFMSALNGTNVIVPPTPTPQSGPAQEEDMPAFVQINSPTGGFWMVAPDGGVFCYNAAGEPNGPGAPPFFGSMSGKPLARPIGGLTPFLQNGVVAGYWLWALDGGVFGFGGARVPDAYPNHPDWHAGDRFVTGLEQHDAGYDLITVETSSSPPRIDRYDLSTAR